jgi:hypothetical protein
MPQRRRKRNNKKMTYEDLESIYRKLPRHDTNGWRIIDFAITKKTWRSPDECTSNQSDHVIIDSWHARYFGCEIMKRCGL